MDTPIRKPLKRSDSRKSVRPGGKSWKKRLVQRSACKSHIHRILERKRMLKK